MRTLMDIGKPLRTIIVEPLELPLREPRVQPEPDRRRTEPTAPQREPEKQPVTR